MMVKYLSEQTVCLVSPPQHPANHHNTITSEMSRLGIYLLFKIQRKTNKDEDEKAALGMKRIHCPNTTQQPSLSQLTLKVCKIQQRLVHQAI